MPPALSRDPQAIKDKIAHLKRQMAERDTEILRLKSQILALQDGVHNVMTMLRDTSTGHSPTRRIASANAWILLLLGQHGLPAPKSKNRR